MLPHDKNKPSQKGVLSDNFNAASWLRVKASHAFLAASSTVNAYTRLVRDDVRRDAWRISYHLPLFVLIALPIPIPLSNVLPVFLLRTAMRARLNTWMTLADIRFAHATRPETMRIAFAGALTLDSEGEREKINILSATAQTARCSYHDVRETLGLLGRAAWRGISAPFQS